MRCRPLWRKGKRMPWIKLFNKGKSFRWKRTSATRWLVLLMGLPSLSGEIHVDQFGYLPHARKVAVLADPQDGFNAADNYEPGAMLELRNIHTGEAIFSASPKAWKGGAVHPQSGDRVWWFDFSPVNLPGEYAIHDPERGRVSDPFSISPHVYDGVLKEALRTFYYQRFNIEKTPPYAGAVWADGAAFPQDEQARWISDPGNPLTERDLRGGWFDAGDYNKYTPWTARVIQMLLLAYKENPSIWTDAAGLPESGNGVPDVLDELLWGLDWMVKMQEPDGSLLTKNGQQGFGAVSPPSSDTSPRFYGAASTYATLSGAAAFALAAEVFAEAGMMERAESFREAALAAWAWAEANPDVGFDNAGFDNADPVPDDAYSLEMMRLRAAVFLYSLTDMGSFDEVVAELYDQAHPIQWTYWYPFEPDTAAALAHYASLEAAHPEVASAILDSLGRALDHPDALKAFREQSDPYRAFLKDADHVWGSNSVRANLGQILSFSHRYRFGLAAAEDTREASAGYLHYIHGVNPLGIVYLTHMDNAGAEHSVQSMYHGWFADGTRWDDWLDDASEYGPPPGYLVGGPNAHFSPDPAYGGELSPPQNQPPQKAFRDWNSSWPQNSWEVTEPAIGYQGAYLRLLATVMGDRNAYLDASPWKFFERGDEDLFFSTRQFDQAGIGQVDDSRYPAIRVMGEASQATRWFEVLPQSASLWSFFAWSYSEGEWIWSSNLYGGWYYGYSTGWQQF